jgi:CubicO group peptidase (beta-lactamase class C family)
MTARSNTSNSNQERQPMNAKRIPENYHLAIPRLIGPTTVAAVFLCLSSSLVGPSCPSARGEDKIAGFSREKLDQISALLKTAVEKKQVAGGSALIARNGQVVFKATVGRQDIEGNLPISDGTIFRIASMSKPITSVGIMILVQDGKLSVTDPLSKFFPEFKEMKVLVPAKDGKSYELVDAKREITIHDLLTHSSGITYRLLNKPFVAQLYADAGVSDGIVETPGRIGDNVRKLAKMPLVCQPGTAWEYGLNTDVLGAVIEAVSGKSLEDFLHERIFEPLKMNDTCFILAKDKRSRLAAIYSSGPDKSLSRFGDKPVTQGTTVISATYPTADGSKYYSGGGGLVSTIGDYFRFCQMMLNRGELDGARVLKPETVDQMTRNQLGDIRIMFPGNDLMGYGFGVLSEKGKETSKDPAAVGSYSWGGAFNTLFWVDPKNELIGVLMLQMFPPDFAVGQEFKRLTYEAMKQSNNN